ncbi:hypothetical protein PAJ34TS1_51650 [Paenibacillus azoreducens]
MLESAAIRGTSFCVDFVKLGMRDLENTGFKWIVILSHKKVKFFSIRNYDKIMWTV